MSLMNQIVERAKANKQRIVLPEGTEERTLKAANQLLADEVAELILIGNPDEIMGLAKEWGLEHIGKATIINPAPTPSQDNTTDTHPSDIGAMPLPQTLGSHHTYVPTTLW